MDQRSPSPGRNVTASAASQLLSESQVEMRRSQRLIDKESRCKTKTKSLENAGSPQLFDETDDEWSQPLCQLLPLTQIVHQEEPVAIKRRSSSVSVKHVVPLKRRKGRPPAKRTTKNAKNSISFYQELHKSQSEVLKSATQWELGEYREQLQRPANSAQDSLQELQQQRPSSQVVHLKKKCGSLHSSNNNENNPLKQLKGQSASQGKAGQGTSFFKQDQRPVTSECFGETYEEQTKEQVIPLKRRKSRAQSKQTQPEVMQEHCPSTTSPIKDSCLSSSQLQLLAKSYKEYSQRICEQQEDRKTSTAYVEKKVPPLDIPLKPPNEGSSTQGKPKQSSTFKRYGTEFQKQSPSKLPPKYPAHFVHQLPPLGGGDRSYMHMRPRAAPAAQLREMCPTPELTPVPEPQKAPLTTFDDLSPPNPGSESSGTLSLSDSIGEIFGTKNISRILNVECPRQYILIEDHLPAMAMMLNVELVRLRAVLDLTQRLTHEQILNWPLKLEKPTND
ncbi:uncharacterized protein mei-P22 [Drosophila pseudoobscura]|uniref:Uncharacterized protein mei-P22 n=1 Tax=Drosophila pseudoobscura pseudoobscura TaxID=46245 RepID=A0A6I8UCU0_DROPS|nr:uncharacterized protein LOC4813150 [Drosophila pseudoobscura]